MAYIFQILCSSFEESVPNQTNSTNRIFAPESLLIRTYHLLDLTENVSLFFRISNGPNRVTHCSIKEFTAQAGLVYLPEWMMGQLQVVSSDRISLQQVFLPKGRLAKFFLQDIGAFTGVNILEVLEVGLRQYSCLTLGDCIEIPVFGQNTRLTVTKLEPANAVDIVDINLTIDLDWKIPSTPEAEQKMPDLDYKIGSIRFWRKPQDSNPSTSKAPKECEKLLFPGQGNRLVPEPETIQNPEPESVMADEPGPITVPPEPGSTTMAPEPGPIIAPPEPGPSAKSQEPKPITVVPEPVTAHLEPGPITAPPEPGPSTLAPEPGPSAKSQEPKPIPEPEPITAHVEPGPITAPPEPGPSTMTPEPGPSAKSQEPKPLTVVPEPEPITAHLEPGPFTAPPEPGPSVARKPEFIIVDLTKTDSKDDDVLKRSITRLQSSIFHSIDLHENDLPSPNPENMNPPERSNEMPSLSESESFAEDLLEDDFSDGEMLNDGVGKIMEVESDISDEDSKETNPISDEKSNETKPTSNEDSKETNPTSNEDSKETNPISDEKSKETNPTSNDDSKETNPTSNEDSKETKPTSNEDSTHRCFIF